MKFHFSKTYHLWHFGQYHLKLLICIKLHVYGFTQSHKGQMIVAVQLCRLCLAWRLHCPESQGTQNSLSYHCSLLVSKYFSASWCLKMLSHHHYPNSVLATPPGDRVQSGRHIYFRPAWNWDPPLWWFEGDTSHILGHLSNWSLVGDTIWGRLELGSVASMEETHHWGWVLRFLSHWSFLVCCFLVVVGVVSSQLFLLPGLVMAVMYPWYSDGDAHFTPWNHSPK